MSTAECVYNKFMDRKLHKLTKMVKPLLRLISRKQRTNSVTPSTCNYYITEALQNKFNETKPLDITFKFSEETEDNLANEAAEARENMLNELLEARLQNNLENNARDSSMGVEVIVGDEIIVEPVVPGMYFATPVQFVETVHGEYTWAPLPDSDICYHGDECPITELQTPQEQTPVF